MKGRVDAYDPVNGFGFVNAGGVLYFAHNSEVRLEMPVSVIADLGTSPPLFLLPGWDVEFEPVKQKDGRWKATEIKPVSPTGYTINPVRQRPTVTQDGTVAVEISEDNVITVLGRKADPVVNADPCFVIYYLGNGVVKGFSVKVPQPTADKTFVLVTPSPEKAPRRPMPDGLYQNVRRGSFIMTVRADGHVLVQKVGAHVYESEDNWLTLLTRFKCKLDLSKPGLSKDEIVAQMPKVGKEDANWGFAPGILRGLELMAATSTTPTT